MRGLDLLTVQAAGLDRRLDLLDRRVAHRLPASGSARAAARNATSRLRSLVDCESTVRIELVERRRRAAARAGVP